MVLRRLRLIVCSSRLVAALKGGCGSSEPRVDFAAERSGRIEEGFAAERSGGDEEALLR
jgi:hypothetical protein